jgi:hypothetical protein
MQPTSFNQSVYEKLYLNGSYKGNILSCKLHAVYKNSIFTYEEIKGRRLYLHWKLRCLGCCSSQQEISCQRHKSCASSLKAMTTSCTLILGTSRVLNFFPFFSFFRFLINDANAKLKVKENLQQRQLQIPPQA